MRKSQLIALILVAIMAVAVIPAMAVAQHQSNPAPAAPSTVGATLTPTLTIGYTPKYPARYQSLTVWGRLTQSTNQLKNKPIWVYWKYPWEYTWHFWTIQHTSTSGYFQFSDNWGQRAVQYLLKFPGDSVYYPASKQVTIYIGGTYTTVYSTSLKPAGNGFSIYGWVTDANLKGIASAPIKAYWRTWTAAGGYGPWAGPWAGTTDADGKYTAPTAFGRVWVQIFVQYEGYPLVSSSHYWESSSATLWIDNT